MFVCFGQAIGCDGIVGSQKRPDACGVCGGDNSTCQIVSGIFTEPQLPAGYNLVAQLPKGACHVNITELKPSRNYFGTLPLTFIFHSFPQQQQQYLFISLYSFFVLVIKFN